MSEGIGGQEGEVNYFQIASIRLRIIPSYSVSHVPHELRGKSLDRAL
jgi:hypothetical protein